MATTKTNGGGSVGNEDEVDQLQASSIVRPSPDAILADEADPDTLLGLESDSEAGGSRPTSMLPAAHKRQSRRMSRQLLNTALNDGVKPSEVTPTKDAFVDALGDDTVLPAEDLPALRGQVSELTTQVTSLNNKLVSSFMRIGDLEDDLSELQEAATSYKQQIAKLEKEREEHLAALNTGLLVEKEHVSTEMQKMMERLVQETAEKGKAVSDKEKIEAELDELSSSLFSEANKMVAVERLARARAEEKSKSMEERLKDTEEIVGQQQKRLVEMQAVVEQAEQSQHVNASEGDKSGPSDSSAGGGVRSIQQLTQSALPHPTSLLIGAHGSHVRLDIVPYVELRTFLNHLRKLRLQLAPFYSYPVNGTAPSGDDQSQASPFSSRTGSPAPSQGMLMTHAGILGSGLSVSSPSSSPFTVAGVTRHKDFPSLPSNVEQLIYLPNQVSSLALLKRINEEDCEPCLRLDIAPGLNWLSRRQMQTAILEGNLMIEPIFGGGIYNEEEVRTRAIGAPSAACAMCGKAVVNVPLPGGGNVSDASTWMSAASSLQAGVNAVASSLPGRDSTASPPPFSGSSATVSSSKESVRSKSSIFNTLRNISGGSSRSASSSTNATSNPTLSNATDPGLVAQQSLALAGLVDDPFVGRPAAIPTHIFRISESSGARYLLCPDHCLRRLRATCDFWGYIRTLERSVVLEGKLAWDDELDAPSNAATRTVTPQPLSKDDDLVLGNLKVNDDAKGDEVGPDGDLDDMNETPSIEVEGEEEHGGAPVKSKEVETGLKPGIQRTRKVSLTHTASDADENDFADAMSQHTDDRSGQNSLQHSDAEEDEEEEEEGEAEADREKEEDEDQEGIDGQGDDQPKKNSIAERDGGEKTQDGLLSLSSSKSSLRVADDDEDGTLEKTPVARRTSLPFNAAPEAARPVPARPLPSLPPALPPRRNQTPSTAVAPASPVTLGPVPKRLLALTSNERLPWEERVWLEVNRLRGDMWSARIGIANVEE